MDFVLRRRFSSAKSQLILRNFNNNFDAIRNGKDFIPSYLDLKDVIFTDRLKKFAPIKRQYIELSSKHGQCSRRLEDVNDNMKRSEAQMLRNEIADIESVFSSIFFKN